MFTMLFFFIKTFLKFLESKHDFLKKKNCPSGVGDTGKACPAGVADTVLG